MDGEGDGEIEDDALSDVAGVDLDLIEDTDVAEVELDALEVDATETTGADTLETTGDGEVAPIANACGGAGVLTPGGVGTTCGPCLDGALACDPSDAEMNRTRCEGASALNACSGCGALDESLGDACATCGQWACSATELGALTCVEPSQGCTTPLVCADLACDLQGRVCVESDGVGDAACGGCSATHELVEGVCVARALTPTGVSATLDRAVDVELRWDAAANAQGYRVYRCDSASCASDSAWTDISGPIVATIFSDTTAAVPGAPSAPTSISATRDRTDRVEVMWAEVRAPLAQKYRYRVTAENAAGETAPSAVVEGARAERPVVGYDLQVDGGTWSPLTELATTWVDDGAEAATVVAGVVSASQGTYAEFVRLASSGAAASVGATRSYRVRATTAYGPAAASSAATGWRVAGALAYQWQRSAGASADEFGALVGADEASYDDTSAPADGATRWYRVQVSAAGAQSVTSVPVSGSRQPPPGVPSSVSASNEEAGYVAVTWQAVSGAIGYHVYRDGTQLTTGTGVTGTSYQDNDAAAVSGTWQAASAVSATSTLTDRVNVGWVAPTRPVGANATYTVRAVNAAGQGPLSTGASGRRAAAALVGYEVEITAAGGNATWVATGSTSVSFSDMSPPKAMINGGTIAVGQGDNRNFVRLTLSGASAVAGANVTYKVRGLLAGGTTTPTSDGATGRRAVGALVRQWQRSSGTGASGFAAIGTNVASYDDTAAPSDGAKRWYQVVLSAAGADPKTVTAAEGWRLAFMSVVGGSSHTVALSTAGRLWTWGYNSNGQLGRTTTNVGFNLPGPMALPSGVSRFTQLGSGFSHACAIADTGDVWCWGQNNEGQLGDGSLVDRTTPVKVVGLAGVAVSVAGGWNHMCVALTNGLAQCWGANGTSALGNNSTSRSLVPVTVLTSSTESLSGVLQVGLGKNHSCARRASDIYCWGDNANAQLGVGTQSQSKLARKVVNVGATTSMAVGYDSACAVVAGGGARCWGSNLYGAYGNGTTTTSLSAVAVTGLTSAAQMGVQQLGSCARLTNGNIQAWGTDGYGFLGFVGSEALTPAAVPGVVGATQIGCGPVHCCAVLSSGGVRCWGSNYWGTLGDGNPDLEQYGLAPLDAVFP